MINEIHCYDQGLYSFCVDAENPPKVGEPVSKSIDLLVTNIRENINGNEWHVDIEFIE